MEYMKPTWWPEIKDKKKKKKTALEGKKAHSVSGLYVWTLSSAMPCFPTIKPDAVGYLDMKDARKKTH